MAQISIPMSNKVGYSMYWSSMWDNKINYSTTLKEDIFLRKIINLLFEDKFSVNLLKSKKKFQKNINIKNFYLHIRLRNVKKNLLKYLTKINRIKIYPSKLWILKFQKWFILFYFIYSPNSNIFIKKNLKKEGSEKLNNFFNLYFLYNKSTAKLSYSYNFYKKSLKKSNF